MPIWEVKLVKTDMSTGGSEETFEFICTPCSKDSIHAEAAVYCVECRECLCQKCFNFHQRLSGLILHKVLDKAGMQAGGAADVTLLPKDTCDVHPGKLIVVYCADHDALCCVECVVEGHGYMFILLSYSTLPTLKIRSLIFEYIG